MKKKMIDVVIPFYNEEGNILGLLNDITSILEKDFGGFDHQIIAVDDGSIDDTRGDLLTYKQTYSGLTSIRLNRNYGQSTAIQAGFDAAEGEYIFTLDGDRQNDPNDFKRLYDHLVEHDLDLVAGWRKKRKDPFWMLFITRSARFLRGLLIKDRVHDSGCTLRIYKKKVIKNLDLRGEMHRYIVSMSVMNGFKVGEIVVNHKARTVGTTKYNRRKSIKGFIDLIYIWFIRKYQGRPLHLFGFLGGVNFLIGIASVLRSIYAKFMYSTDLSDNGVLFVGIFLGQIGLMLFIFGIVIDLLIRTHINSMGVSRYIVREEI